MRKFLLVLVLLVAFGFLSLVTNQAEAEEAVCGQFKHELTEYGWGWTVFLPCGAGDSWVMGGYFPNDPQSTTEFPPGYSSGSYARIHKPDTAECPDGICLFGWAGIEPISSCSACMPATPIPADNSAFVADVTIKDGTAVNPGQTVNKTWRVRNSGSTTWTPAYQVVHVSGERFGASNASIKANIARGATLDVTLALKAPQKPGTYSGTFQLQSANGQRFGTKLTVMMKVPAAQAAVSNAQQMWVMLDEGRFTSLRIEGTNQSGKNVTYSANYPSPGRTNIIVTGWWWEGTAVVTISGPSTRVQCPIDYVGGKIPITVIRYSAQKGCRGGAGNAYDPLMRKQQAWIMALDQESKTGLLVDALMLPDAAGKCVDAAMSGSAARAVVCGVKASKALEDILKAVPVPK